MLAALGVDGAGARYDNSFSRGIDHETSTATIIKSLVLIASRLVRPKRCDDWRVLGCENQDCRSDQGQVRESSVQSGFPVGLNCLKLSRRLRHL